MERSAIIDQMNKFKTKLASNGEDWPATLWTSVTNEWGAGSVLIVVPEAGTLWVYYEYSNAQAEVIEVWHEGGTTTPIQLGPNEIPVGEGDFIYYQLANPASDAIKLAYQML